MPPIYADRGAASAPVSPPPPAPPPPPPPPAPPPYTVKPGQTLRSIADEHHVTPQELANANHIAPDGRVEPGQQLQLPPDARLSTQEQHQNAPQTPKEKTDAAYDKLLQAQYAVKSDQGTPGGRADLNDAYATLAKAKANFDKSVQDEVAGQVAQTGNGVPAEFRTPTDKLIAQYGAQIEARYKGDPATQTEVRQAVADYQVQAKADSLIPGYYGDFSAVEKLKGIDLTGQPQAVIDKVLSDPRVQQWIKDAAKEVGHQEPSKAIETLNDLFKDQPGLATAVTRTWWQSNDPDTINSTVATCLNATEQPESYAALAQLYASLGKTPAGQEVQGQIADTLGHYSANNILLSSGNFQRAIGEGADPALLLAAASKLQSEGKTDQAKQLVGSVVGAVNLFTKQKMAEDTEAYAKLTEGLNWFIKNLGPSMTDTQKQKAVSDYIASKGKDWQNQVDAAKAKIVADTRQLDTDLNALQHLPGNLQSSYGQLAQSAVSNVLNDENVQQTMEFAIAQDPSVFAGEQGSKAAQLWVEVAHKSKDFTAALAKAYVTGHVLPELKGLNPNDPASVAKARQALEELRSNAGVLGLPKEDLDKGINQLEKVLGSLDKESIQDAIHGKGINALGKVTGELKELSETRFSSGAAGLLFRTVAFGLTGAALINQAGELAEKPTLQNMIGTLALSAGFTQDTTALAAKVGLIDKSGSLGSWGLGSSPVGDATEKFLGVLGIAYYVAGGVSALSEHDAPGAALNASAALGLGIATFGEAAWTGPVRWGITLASVVALGWYEHIHEANKYEPQNNNETVPFLMHAGFSEAAANALCNQSGDGYSPAALLAEYAKDKGYDLSNPAQQKKFVDWVNDLAKNNKAMTNIRDLLNMAQDKFGGDVGKLSKDTTQYMPTEIDGGGNQLSAPPGSVGQIDAYLANDGASGLPPP